MNEDDGEDMMLNFATTPAGGDAPGSKKRKESSKARYVRQHKKQKPASGASAPKAYGAAASQHATPGAVGGRAGGAGESRPPGSGAGRAKKGATWNAGQPEKLIAGRVSQRAPVLSSNFPSAGAGGVSKLLVNGSTAATGAASVPPSSAYGGGGGAGVAGKAGPGPGGKEEAQGEVHTAPSAPLGPPAGAPGAPKGALGKRGAGAEVGAAAGEAAGAAAAGGGGGHKGVGRGGPHLTQGKVARPGARVPGEHLTQGKTAGSGAKVPGEHLTGAKREGDEDVAGDGKKSDGEGKGRGKGGGRDSTRAEPLSKEAAARVFAAETFGELGLSSQLALHIEGHLGFKSPTHIQKAAIPPLLARQDVRRTSPLRPPPLLLSPALALSLVPHAAGTCRCPTLWAPPALAVSIDIVAHGILGVAGKLVARFVWLVPGHVMGGENKAKEKARLRKGVTILVATPGRLLDHLRSTASFRTDNLEWLVLDEADRLLDLGFEKDIHEILALLDSRKRAAPPPPRSGGPAALTQQRGQAGGAGSGAAPAAGPKRPRQTVLLSATLGTRVEQLAHVSLNEPITVGHAYLANLKQLAARTAVKKKEEEDDEKGQQVGEQGQGEADRCRDGAAAAPGGTGRGGSGGGEKGSGEGQVDSEDDGPLFAQALRALGSDDNVDDNELPPRGGLLPAKTPGGQHRRLGGEEEGGGEEAEWEEQEEQEMVTRGGHAGGLSEAYRIPSQLSQSYIKGKLALSIFLIISQYFSLLLIIFIPCRLRLVALATLLRHLALSRPKFKAVVFFSTCDSVEFHHLALSAFSTDSYYDPKSKSTAPRGATAGDRHASSLLSPAPASATAAGGATSSMTSLSDQFAHFSQSRLSSTKDKKKANEKKREMGLSEGRGKKGGGEGSSGEDEEREEGGGGGGGEHEGREEGEEGEEDEGVDGREGAEGDGELGEGGRATVREEKKRAKEREEEKKQKESEKEVAARYVKCPLFKLHGNLAQRERGAAFFAFREATSGVLLCTDVAARGLDFPSVTCIVQYDPPGEAADYVHRVGRTARLGQRGEAVLFLQPAEGDYLAELHAHSVRPLEAPLEQLFDQIPIARRLKKGERQAPEAPENHFGAASLQVRLEALVAQQDNLRQLATDGFRSFVRAYAAHKGPLKRIFHPKRLHFGHVAKSFALTDAPSLLGQSSTKQALKLQKMELAKKYARKKHRVTILVATPGRLLDHLRSTASFRTDNLEWLVLDEADRLLDLGFEKDIHEILALLDSRKRAAPPPPRSGGPAALTQQRGQAGGAGSGAAPAAGPKRPRQTVLLSATLGTRVEQLAHVSLNEPITVGHAYLANLKQLAARTAVKKKEEEDDEKGQQVGEQGQGEADRCRDGAAAAPGGTGRGGSGGGEKGSGEGQVDSEDDGPLFAQALRALGSDDNVDDNELPPRGGLLPAKTPGGQHRRLGGEEEGGGEEAEWEEQEEQEMVTRGGHAGGLSEAYRIPSQLSQSYIKGKLALSIFLIISQYFSLLLIIFS
eukprot:jgi/Mesen1/1910/ME000143S00967